MKTLALFSLFLFSTLSHAATFDADRIERLWAAGQELVNKATNENKMQYTLNPVICEQHNFNIVVVYSSDFRTDQLVYEFVDGYVMGFNSVGYKIQELGAHETIGDLETFDVIFNDTRSATCVMSNIVLEGVGG